MKKIYSTIFSIAVLGTYCFSQQRMANGTPVPVPKGISKNQTTVQPMNVVDTLTAHFNISAGGDPFLYSSQGGGYVAGQNGYGDLAKAQKFDATYGVTAGGTINAVLFWFGGKKQNAGTASFTPTIWDDNGGIPGTVLGTGASFTVAQIDTSPAAYSLIGSPTEGVYNVTSALSAPVAIPVNQTFWAGFTMTYAAGDSAGLVTSTDSTAQDGIGVTGDFSDANTHTFELWDPSPWTTFNDGTIGPGPTWGLDIAMAIYPVVDLTINVNENNNHVVSLHNTPNPAVNSTTISYALKEAANASISVFDITGKQVRTYPQGIKTAGSHTLKIDVSNLNAGMYFYTLTAGKYKMTGKMNVVK